jgi:hypothetical protein
MKSVFWGKKCLPMENLLTVATRILSDSARKSNSKEALGNYNKTRIT